MGSNLDSVPEAVREHIRSIAKSSGLPDTEESVEKIAAAWIEKRSCFDERIEENKMNEIDEYDPQEERGALLLTYSGSLITIGPLSEGTRSVEYNSIGLRQDVPDSARSESSALVETVSIDAPATFTDGPIKKSSAIYAIAINPEDLSHEEEDALLTSVTEVLVEDFVEVNKTIIND
jgi:hypothetical protein